MTASPPKRIPSLDGLRTIALLFVFLAHGGVSHGAPTWMSYAPDNFGVRIFFVISGFIITHLLLKERARAGTIDLGGFYVRRAYRLLPAAYVYMLVITLARWDTLTRTDLVTSYLYLANYHEHHAWHLGHLWSLGAQEQFYLLWPIVLVLLFPHRRGVLIATLAFGPLFRAALLFAYSRHLPVQFQSVIFWFPSVADALATGCLLAVLRPALDRHARILEHRLMLAVPAVTLLLVLTQRVQWRYTFAVYQVLLIPLIHAGIALTIDHCIRRRYWILNARPVAWCGAVSFSLYLWQQPFLISSEKAGAVAFWERFPLNVGFTFVAGALSYYLVEQPIQRLRERRTRRAAPLVPAPVTEPAAGPGAR